MRKIAFSVLAISSIIGCTAAMAADLPPAAPLPPRAPAAYIPAPPPFSWTGFYVGINGGYGWNQWSNPDGTLAVFGNSFNGSGPARRRPDRFQLPDRPIRGRRRCRFRLGQYQMVSVNRHRPRRFGVFGGTISSTISDKDQFLSTFGARFGYAFDHALLYAKAGGAWEREQFNLSVTNFAGAVASGSTNTNRLGWMLGGGLEYAVTNNFTLKAEYNYVNFGTYNQTITIAGGGFAGGTATFNTEAEHQPRQSWRELPVQLVLMPGPQRGPAGSFSTSSADNSALLSY